MNPHTANSRSRADEPRSEQSRLDDSAARTADNAEQIADELRASAQEVQAFLGDSMQRRPYTTLGTALALGYVLGGGVPRTLTALALGLGSRVAMSWLATNISASLPSGAQAHADLRTEPAASDLQG